jgi:hypothetical protein
MIVDYILQVVGSTNVFWTVSTISSVKLHNSSVQYHTLLGYEYFIYTLWTKL